MCHTFKHFIHMQYFLLLTNLVIVFVHWVSTGVLYKLRQYSLFWDYIPESNFCFCLNLCRSSGPYSIRPIQKLLICQTINGARWVLLPHSSRWRATKNTNSRNDMISIHQRSARTNEGKSTLLQSYSTTVSWMLMVATGLENSPFYVYTASQSFPWWRPWRIRTQRTRLSQVENSAMGTWPIYKNYYTRLVRTMAWYNFLILVCMV